MRFYFHCVFQMSLQRKLVMPALYRASTSLLLMSKEDVDGRD
jgi:hypothetical protein